MGVDRRISFRGPTACGTPDRVFCAGGTAVLLLIASSCGGSAASSISSTQSGVYSVSQVQQTFARHHEPLRDEAPRRILWRGVAPDSEITYFTSGPRIGPIVYGPRQGEIVHVVVFKDKLAARRAAAAERVRSSGGLIIQTTRNVLIVTVPAEDGRPPARVGAALAELRRS